MRKQDDVSDAPRGRVLGTLLLMLAGCLNPRPEELPSNASLDPSPNAAPSAAGTASSDEGSTERANTPDVGSNADLSDEPPSDQSAPQLPAPPSAPPPPDAGVDAGGDVPDAG